MTQEEALGRARPASLGAGDRIEVRRVTDESDLAGHADHEYLQKQRQWRAEERA